MTRASQRILLGCIVGAHGIRGEVIVHAFTQTPEAIAGYGPLQDASGRLSLALRVVRVTDKGVIARVAGVADRNGAEALKGTELWVARDKLPAAEEGEYYHADLIGLDAIAPDGSAVGKIVAVQNYGAGDLLEIRLEGSRNTELVLFTNEFVPEVDIAAGRVVVVMPAGDGSDTATDGDEPI